MKDSVRCRRKLCGERKASKGRQRVVGSGEDVLSRSKPLAVVINKGPGRVCRNLSLEHRHRVCENGAQVGGVVACSMEGSRVLGRHSINSRQRSIAGLGHLCNSVRIRSVTCGSSIVTGSVQHGMGSGNAGIGSTGISSSRVGSRKSSTSGGDASMSMGTASKRMMRGRVRICRGRESRER